MRPSRGRQPAGNHGSGAVSRAPTPLDLLHLVQLLDEDAERPAAERRRRDRALGRRLRDADDTTLLLGWIDAQRDRHESPGLLPITVPALLLAALAGWGTATAVFFYDGGGRVNVVTVLAVFVILQALLLLAFVLAALPPAWSRFVPGLGALARLAAALSPARLASLLARWLPGGTRRYLDVLLGDTARHHQVLARPARWLLLALSQDMALAFNLAALATAGALVVFTDLAFGWATTLGAGDADFHALVRALATPWATLLPAAVPDAELVAASRYFRLAENPADAALLTRWWPFVLTCMAVYGVAPRVLSASIAHWRLASATRAALCSLPAARALLHRMRSALVETAADAAQHDDDAGSDGGNSADADAVVLDPPVHLIDWAALPVAPERLAMLLGRRLGFEVEAVHAAGGNRTLAEDRATARAVAMAGSVVVACKAWEPPLLELRDFLHVLRETLPARTVIAVVPVEIADDALVAPAARHVAQWRDALRGIGDPYLVLLRTHAEPSQALA